VTCVFLHKNKHARAASWWGLLEIKRNFFYYFLPVFQAGSDDHDHQCRLITPSTKINGDSGLWTGCDELYVVVRGAGVHFTSPMTNHPRVLNQPWEEGTNQLQWTICSSEEQEPFSHEEPEPGKVASPWGLRLSRRSSAGEAVLNRPLVTRPVVQPLGYSTTQALHHTSTRPTQG
jgi:hypothetical protein